MTRTGRFVLPIMLLLLMPCNVGFAQIRPLDDDTLREAMAPYTKMPANVLLPPFDYRHPEYTLEQQIATGPFRVTFITPYYSAWEQASENRRKFLAPPVLSARELNDHDVLVHVRPTRYAPAGTLEAIVVKRGDVITRPLKDARVMTQHGEEVGFLFRFSDFAAELGAYSLICITKSSNFEFFVSNDAIYGMR